MIINDLYESPQLCPECGGISFSDLILAEKKDACYYKVKASAKVWPSAYASGRLVQCRKKGAANYGNKSESVAEGSLAEMDKSAPQPGRDGRVSHSTYGSRDKGGSKGPKKEARPITAKKAKQDALDVLKKQGVAEGMDRLYPFERTVIDYMQDNSWLSAERAYFRYLGLQKKKQTNPHRWAEEIQHFIDLYNKYKGPQGVAEGSLTEFAPSDTGDNDGGGFDERMLKRLAAQWYLGDEDPRVERTLAMAGWEIGQDEGYEDEPGVFVVMTGDEHGSSYMSWPAQELKQGVAEGEIEKTKTGIIHRSSGPYGGGEASRAPNDPGKYAKDIDYLDKNLTSKLDKSMGIKWPHGNKKSGMDEGEQQKGADYRDPKEADYGADYQDMVARVKKLAGVGPMKTVWDPQKRVYRNMPTAVQPKK